jgi:hypothetical protein
MARLKVKLVISFLTSENFAFLANLLNLFIFLKAELITPVGRKEGRNETRGFYQSNSNIGY